jgi:hypothetical protein
VTERSADAILRADAADARALVSDARADAADARALVSDARADAADARAVESDARADAADEKAAHLQVALDSRGVIGMAMGILMHAENIGPEEAFEVLRHASQNQNKKLHAVAAELVAKYPMQVPPA